MPEKFNSSKFKEVDYTEDFEESLPGMGGMIVTFPRGDQYIYYPMIKIVYDTHLNNMREEEKTGSAGTYFRKHIQNMFKFKKL